MVLDIDVDVAVDAAAPASLEVSGFRVLREERIYRGLCDRCTS
jgi:hypothetical protein